MVSETDEKLQGWYLGLFFIKTKDGAWRNASLRGTAVNMTLPELLTEFKTRDLPADSRQK